ncbi:Ni/Fe hydrogenase subunit alpha [Fulvivirga sedimenti]|uniref:Ni/Fe hydrogenase subunit alpha n=1 Tax=Fulvivirga sedimenti TaxID=2879465 RepID=A0A9X1HST9_9BACT|nr:Ni/Fe hydrogenase subunit alpha [Fulvivirga sedimenti]MCA6075121.1 Ni/Fe hydrogenase subunit alpha [Fulvivirga sedimenti]MCA6076298.1 Ni/Fe hydrogenase subunit alpha [Fulvivirga sedimenti]MCA6077426.1 Ni/Fe hydrogenase subunit alpha [Fulvivirga sedimenti]
MSRKVVIDPVTRVEGHGRVTIHLDEYGKVEDSFFHIVEFRGFERFIQGRPYWEAPVLVQRLCGICPVSHHLAAAKAIDQIVGVDPEDLSPTATKLRRLMHYGQIFQSHALHFFYLASPDLLFGMDAPVQKRNVFEVAIENKELAKKGILMRKFGQEIIKAIAGKKIHGVAAVPGGVYKVFNPEEREYFLNGKDIPNIETMIQWSQEVLAFIKAYAEKHHSLLDTFAEFPSGHLGMVDDQGNLEMYHGLLRAIDSTGNTTLNDVSTNDYQQYFLEGVERWSYMKFPYLKNIGPQKGWNRVGPLARINVCDKISTPLAEQERREFFSFSAKKVNNSTLYAHWARLIEILHCAEIMRDLLNDDELLSDDLFREGTPRNEGIGIIEAPRGTLTHHYQVDDHGMITKCNLIVSTTHNNEAMNHAVRWVADHVISEKGTITEGMLNQVEVAIRAYDPCLSCATQALGQMSLKAELYDHTGSLIHQIVRNGE